MVCVVRPWGVSYYNQEQYILEMFGYLGEKYQCLEQKTFVSHIKDFRFLLLI